MPEKSLTELKEIVGESRVTVEKFTIEAGKIAEFAAALRSEDTVYRDGDEATERGFTSIPAPLTFTEVRRHSHNRPADFDADGIQGFDLGFDDERTVHGEQAYEYERQPQVGDTLTGTTTLTDVSQRQGDGTMLTFANLRTEYRTDDGELVLTERLTAIET